MGKLLVFLLFLGAAFGVYQFTVEYKARQKAARNVWPEKLAGILQHHVLARTAADKAHQAESALLQLVYMADQIESDGFAVADNLKRAAVLAGASSSESSVIAAAVIENLDRARQLGAFEDPANLLKMERGDCPLALAPGWEKEKLVLGYKISPLLSAELAAVVPNMVIMPEAVRDMQSLATPPEASQLASQWLGARVINPETADAIRQRALQEASNR